MILRLYEKKTIFFPLVYLDEEENIKGGIHFDNFDNELLNKYKKKS
jgi:hypothetical protein